MSVEVHRADPKVRRLAPIWLLGTTIVGGLAVWGLHQWLQTRLARAVGGDIDGLLFAVTGLVVVLATVSLGLAYSLWQEASRIRREDRFPPSDMHTLHDVPIRHGQEARRAAVLMRWGAALAAAGGVGILAWGYRLIQLVA